MEKDLHSNTWAYTLCHKEKVSQHCSVKQSFIIDVRQLEIDLFLLRSPLFSPGCKASGNQTSLISYTCRVKWLLKNPYKSP